MKTVAYYLGATALVASLLALPLLEASAASGVKQSAEQAPVVFSALEDAAIARHENANIHRTIRLAQGKVDINKSKAKKKGTSQSPTAAQKKKKGRSLLGGDIGIPQKTGSSGPRTTTGTKGITSTDLGSGR